MNAILVQFENENFSVINVLVRKTKNIKKAVNTVKSYQGKFRCVIKNAVVFVNGNIDYDNCAISNDKLKFYFHLIFN